MKIYQIIESIGKVKTKKERIAILQKHNSLGLRDILKGAYDETIQWDLPEGEVPLKEEEIPEKPKWNLVEVTPKLAICVKNRRNANVPSLKKEVTFLELVKNVDRKDAEILLKMKDKKFNRTFHGLTKALVQEAFPNLIVK
jgi:hypothetical protein